MKTITEFKSIESFSTARLIATKVNTGDLGKFIAMNADPKVMEPLGGVRNIEQSKQDLERHLSRWKENGFGSWIFYLKDTGEWIGRAGLRRLTVAGNEEVEIGYALRPCFWNQGFATEVLTAVAEVGFEVIRLNNIVSFTEESNKASLRVMQKVGFQYERGFEYEGIHHVLYRLKNPRKIEVFPYSKQWPDFFKHESHHIQQVLGNLLKEIYHIGSTAIPNMPAKPVIDILLVCENLDAIDDVTQRLNTLNYYNIRRHVIPHRSFFTRRQDVHISFNLHIRERGDPQINRHINFRDYVIEHSDAAKRYAELKIKLAEQYTDDINSYVLGKDKLVQEIDTKAKLWNARKKDYLPPNTGPYSREWSQEKLIKAIEANLNVQMTHFAQYLNHVELIRIPGFTIVNSGLEDDTFNYVLEADFSSSEACNKIKEVTDYFQEKNVPFSWWVSPYDKPEDLSIYLKESGYVNAENNNAMYIDLDTLDGHNPIPSDLKIIQAKDENTFKDFALILANNENTIKEYYEWIASIYTDEDPIEFYVGYVNNKPVVRGVSCYFAQVAGLYWLSTASNERKKGYGKAMQTYQLRHAKELGYHVAVLQASSEAYPLYEKLGYKDCGLFREFKIIEKNTE